MLRSVVLVGATFIQITRAASSECRDLNGRRISQGLHYVPGPDTCTLCVCDNGNPKWCKAVLCQPPQDCKSFRVGNSCCEFICLDDTLSKNDGTGFDENADLGLRLIASAVTAILSLSLLFFLIHRLRQRKLRGRQNRQLSEDERSLGSIGYITGSIGYLQGSMAYLGNGTNELEFHYEEPPSHYPLWKPPGNYFPRGEAPPPYEEAVAAARAEAAMIASSVSSAVTGTHSQQQTSGAAVAPVPTVAAAAAAVAAATSHNTVTSQTDITCPRTEVSTITVARPAHRAEVATNTSRNDLNGVRSVADRASVVEANKNEQHKNTRNETQSKSDRQSQSSNTAISLISHNGHRTIPRNLTNSSYSAAGDKSSRRETAQAEATAITIEPKMSHKRTTLPKEKVIDSNPLTVQSEIFYEDITPLTLSSLLSNHKESYPVNLEIINGRHRTIPRHLTNPAGFVNSKAFTLGHSSISNVIGSKIKETTSNISLPTSPVPPPVVFSSESNAGESKRLLGSGSKHGNSSSGVIASKHSTGAVTKLKKVPEEIVTSSKDMSPSRDVESSLDGSYQCLHQAFDDGDDYRSECENCKSAHGSRYYLAEDDEDELSSPNETMTLQRRPLDPPTDTLSHGSSYYRTSLTLPTNTRKHRSTSMHGTPSNGAREAWFSSMPESTSSESEEE